MGSKLRGWLRWLVALLGHIAELHPGTVTFGIGAPPAELPRRPARAVQPDHGRRPSADSAVPHTATSAQASTQRQIGSEPVRYRRAQMD